MKDHFPSCGIALVLAACGPRSTTAPSGSPELELLSLTAVPGEDPVHRAAIQVRASAAVTLELRCEAPAEPAELHVLSSDIAWVESTLWVDGLLADTEYSCELWATEPGSGEVVEGALGLHTGPLPEELPEMSVSWPTGEPERAHGGYVLFNHWTQDGDPKVQKAVMVDPEGRVRWSHVLDLEVSVGVEVNSPEPGVVLIAGGRGYNPSFVDYSGEILYRSPDPVSGGVYHHHAELLPSGDILSLASAENELDGLSWEGFLLETRAAWTGLVSWSWDSQLAVDAGLLPAGSQDSDAYHANAVQWVEDPDGEAVMVSLRYQGWILRIDPDTDTISWRLGAGGDFELLDPQGEALPDEEWFYGQHDPELDFPSLLVHDNGWSRPGEDYTRAVEYELDLDAMTATRVWSYTEPGWYEPIWGDVDRLPSGHVLIAQGHCYDCGAGDPERRTAIIEVDPATNEVLWRLDMPGERDAVYRADAVPGCAAFSNRRYCPEGS